MKKYVNGKYIEMTQAEIEEFKSHTPQISEEEKDTTEERIAKIEKAISKLEGFLSKLGVK